MILHIENEDYRLESDKDQWSITRKSVNGKTGAVSWNPLPSYHATFEAGKRRLGRILVMTSELEGVEEALKRIDQIETRLTKALSEMGA